MNMEKCKYLLFCGTLALWMAGGFQQVYAATEPSSQAIQQQSNKVTGKVSDATGPIIGASVVEKGTANGTITDLDGNFSLNVKAGATLVVSYVGYKSEEVKAGRGPLNITLKEDAKALDEVVVTALGIKRERKALGYGIDEVKGEALTKAKETNLINSMAGRVPGLVVSQTAGGPSGSTRVILRGSTEMTGNNQPLYVVDGVPLDNTNFGSAGTNGGFDLGDGISSINADDVENMSVLKGPAASALYGSRASHGVILITTKRANKDKISVEYNGTLTFDTQLAKWDEVQQIYGMGSNGTYSYDAISNTNKSWGPKADGSNMLKYFDGVERPFLIVPDNTSNFFRTGITATNSAIIGVNSGKTGIRFTYTDMRNKDIVPQTHMSRDIFNLRANTSAGKVDLDFSVNYTREDVKNRPALGDSKSNIGKNLMTLATTYDQEWLQTYQTADGEYSNWNGMDPYNVNPYWDIYKNFNKSKKDLFRMNGKAVWNIDPHLKLQATLGAELNWFTFDDYKAPTTPGFEAGRLQNSAFRNRMYNFEVLALYNNHWGDFDFNATLGGNVYKVNNQTTVTTAQDMKIRDVPSLTSFNEISVVPGSYRKQINSVYGAVNVGWKHMLYLDATLRGDQSSTLPTGNNMYVYPSFSGSFVFSELTKLGDLLPYGKVRMSWAQVGSDTDPYQLGLVYTKSKYAYPGYTIGYIDNGTIPNKDLKPTKTNSVEMGLELKFLKNRIGLDFTYYSQISKNQIMGMASSWTTGYNYRFSKLAVDAFESRVRLYKGEWQTAYNAAERVLEQKSTLEDYNNNNSTDFQMPNTYTSVESITAYENVYSRNGINASLATPTFVKMFKEGDLRTERYFGDADEKNDGNYKIIKTYETSQYKCTFRTAELYLNAAEALAQLDQLPEARDYLLKLMEKRYTSAGYTQKKNEVNAMNQAELITEILNERARELAFEGHRWFDLRRTTRPEQRKIIDGQTLILSQDDERYTLRIPQSAIAANPDLMN